MRRNCVRMCVVLWVRVHAYKVFGSSVHLEVRERRRSVTSVSAVSGCVSMTHSSRGRAQLCVIV